MSGQITNPFGDSLNSGVAKMGMNVVQNEVKKYFPIQPSGIVGSIFTKQIRQYFDVNTQLVYKKILKILVPFKTFQWDDQVKKLQLYIPIISFVTLILFSTLVAGINSERYLLLLVSFDPKIGKKALWIVVFSIIQIGLAKCTQNAISNLNIGFLQLTSLVSYRFVPLSLLTIILTVTGGLPYLNLIGLIYLLISDTYFCKIELSNYARDMFKEEGLGNKIALCFHFVTTLAIAWLCDLL